MQAQTIAKPIRMFGVLALLAVLLPACVSFGCWYGCGPNLGPPKPQLSPREAAQVQAQELSRQAEVHLRKGRYRQAERALKESIRVYENALGREAPHLLGPVTNLANLYIYTDRFDKAKRLVGRAHDRDEVLRRLSVGGISIFFTLRTSDPEKWEASRKAFFAEFDYECRRCASD